jgi:hypothetical protein
MIKKQLIVALVLILLIPLVLTTGGMLFSLINPEMAAGHPNYARNYHLLDLLRLTVFRASLVVVVALWLLGCLLVIRSRKRSSLWLFLAVLGPLGFALLAMLSDREPGKTDRYTRFLSRMNGWTRGAYELCTFVIVWVLAFEAMVLKSKLMIWYESVTTGVSTAQIMSIRDASSGMWAFGELNEVMYLVILFYVLRPIVFCIVGHAAATMTSPRAS